jgi:hypothetical protein
LTVNRYLFCVTEIHPPAEVPVEESVADLKEREAARLEVPPVKPGDDPPTCGDEGGGSLYPGRSLEQPAAIRRPTLLRRLALQVIRFRHRLQGFP